MRPDYKSCLILASAFMYVLTNTSYSIYVDNEATNTSADI